jgi:hypothetical protein
VYLKADGSRTPWEKCSEWRRVESRQQGSRGKGRKEGTRTGMKEGGREGGREACLHGIEVHKGLRRPRFPEGS